MRHEIVLAPEAIADLKALDAHRRSLVRDALEAHLRHRPEMVSKSRIKRLQGLRHPQYRLRIAELRAYYDVNEGIVEILAIIPKAEADEWLERAGEWE
jgi:mRNA interferase RelE/StbE